MWGAVLLTSMITGAFCAVFAMVIDVITDALSLWMVAALAFVSGFAGSFFAQVVLKRAR
jgi:phage-related holin